MPYIYSSAKTLCLIPHYYYITLRVYLARRCKASLLIIYPMLKNICLSLLNNFTTFTTGLINFMMVRPLYQYYFTALLLRSPKINACKRATSKQKWYTSSLHSQIFMRPTYFVMKPIYSSNAFSSGYIMFRNGRNIPWNDCNNAVGKHVYTYWCLFVRVVYCIESVVCGV